MKKITSSLLLGTAILVTSFSCNKERNIDFCTKDRVTEDTVFNRTGTIYFIEPYQRWGIRIDSAIASMDDTFIGFPCELPQALQKKEFQVRFSGILKRLNEDEIVKPSLATGHYYYVELSSIESKN